MGDSWATGTSEIFPKPDRLSDPNRTGGFVIEHRGTTISRLLFSHERPQASGKLLRLKSTIEVETIHKD